MSRRKKFSVQQPILQEQKYVPQWELVKLQSLVFILNFLDGTDINRARQSMLGFLKRNKKYKKKLQKETIRNFDYLENFSFRKFPKESIKEAKREINKLAQIVWP
jgi:hypothetical protein